MSITSLLMRLAGKRAPKPDAATQARRAIADMRSDAAGTRRLWPGATACGATDSALGGGNDDC